MTLSLYGSLCKRCMTEMETIADFIAHVFVEGVAPEGVVGDVIAFSSLFSQPRGS